MIARRFAPAQPIAVRVRPGGDLPAAFRWRGRTRRVRRVEEGWELVAAWWRGGPGAVRRGYFRLVTREGLRCVIYRDLGSGRWFLEQVLD